MIAHTTDGDVFCTYHPGADLTSELLCLGCYHESQYGDSFIGDTIDDCDDDD